MPVIDATKCTRALRKRLEAEQDPILRRNIHVVITHLECELRGDLAGIMATVGPAPVYRFYSSLPGSSSGITEVRGLEAVRAMYTAQIEMGSLLAQESTEEIIVVDTHTVATECLAKLGVPGELLLAAGNTSVSAGVKYFFEGHVSCFIPITDDGLIGGEVVYMDAQGFEGIEKRPLLSADIVPLC